MLQSFRKLQGFEIQADDGKIGKSHNFFFDNESWTIRYLIVDTGHWMTGRLVLISTSALREPDWRNEIFPVHLRKSKIQNSPEIHWQKPVSRQQEMELGEYYGWPTYWAGIAAAMPGTITEIAVNQAFHDPADKFSGKQERKESHLRSINEVINYKARADGKIIGRVVDFIIEDKTWIIRYLVVVFRKWFHWLPGGKKILLSPRWIFNVLWSENSVDLKVEKKILEKAPTYDPSKEIGRDYEIRLYKYFGKPEYWLEEKAKIPYFE